jgi:lysophospholipase
MLDMIPPEGLEKRFTKPEGMRWQGFTRNGRKIRFGFVFPKDSTPDAIVVCLPGLSEFGEKYFETARELNAHNIAFYVIDWMGQGGSGRYLGNPLMRHAASFDEDIEDLHHLVTKHILNSDIHPDIGGIPLVMLGHSMGGHLGLKFLAKYPGMFTCAAFTAPFLGIHSLSRIPGFLLRFIAGSLYGISPTHYAIGQKDWAIGQRPNPGYDEFSSDLARGSLHERWMVCNPELRLGGVTTRWVFEALKSCHSLAKDLRSIETHCLVAMADKEKIVDNIAILKLPYTMKKITLLKMHHAKHEILMEPDNIRNVFMDSFYQLIKNAITDKQAY